MPYKLQCRVLLKHMALQRETTAYRRSVIGLLRPQNHTASVLERLLTGQHQLFQKRHNAVGLSSSNKELISLDKDIKNLFKKISKKEDHFSYDRPVQ